MSGQNYGAVREYRDDPFSSNYRDEPDFSFDQQFENLASNIAKINNGATNIERAAKVIGTDRDNGQAGDKIHTVSLDTNNIVTETTRLMKQLSRKKLNRAQRLKMDKIKNDFQECLQRFQTLQKKAAQKVKDVGRMEKPKPKPSAGWLDDDDDPSHLVEDNTRKQQLLAQEQVIDDDLALIREREEQIRALEGDILDVNEIFRDLGAMVYDQGQQIDTIEGNVEKAYTDVEQGRVQLSKVPTYQKKSRRKMCCLIAILLVVAGVITIIVVVSVKNNIPIEDHCNSFDNSIFVDRFAINNIRQHLNHLSKLFNLSMKTCLIDKPYLLTYYQTITTFDQFVSDISGKHCWKRRNCS